MPSDTNPYGGVFGGWLMGQMGLACGSFASRHSGGKAILVAAESIKFPGAMAVGAVLYTNTPEYGVTPPTVASFSSRGGTLVNGVNRNKPDFCAPNGVNTSVNLGGVDYESDGIPNFFGTSASAPSRITCATSGRSSSRRFTAWELRVLTMSESHSEKRW